MDELIKQYRELENALEQVKSTIVNKLGFKDGFEWISSGKETDYKIMEETTIDEVRYAIVNVDDTDHEYHSALFIFKG